MYAKQLIFSQAGATARLCPPKAASVKSMAATIRLVSTSTTNRNRNDHQTPDAQRQTAQSVKDKASQGVRHVAHEIKESWDDLAKGTKSELRTAAEIAASVAREKAERASQTASNLAGRAREAAARATERAGAIPSEVSGINRSAGDLLNQSIDTEEDKIASLSTASPRRRRESPLRSEDVRAAQAKEEANINDLVDELEDKVRNLDHVKECIPKSSANSFAQQQRQQQQQQQQQQSSNRRY